MINPKEQSRVLSFFEQLKSSPTGWQKCIEVISLNSVDDQLKFFALQVIENYLKTQYPALSVEHSERLIVRGFVHHWLHQIDGKTKISTSYFLKNKIAQLFCLIFLADFPFK
uniref:Exportin-T n=1 Tax=Romanomermis culicivorax TaxID=13658 RepID=A0A915L246_ROMCU